MAILLPGCLSPTGGQVSHQKKRLNMSGQNENRLLKTGDFFDITLKSRGAIGLQLMYKAEPEDIATVSRLKTDIISNPQPGDTINAVFRIKATKAGKCKITFYETQPWNKDFKPNIQKKIILKVKDDE
jgi:hypothetical protein